MRILLIDDDEKVLATIGDFLAQRGHGLTRAHSGQEALRRMGETVPDLVLCDIRMPGMDGLAFLRTARERFPETPVIVMTGDRDLDTAVAAFRNGACDYLKKPVKLQELLACISKAKAAGIEEEMQNVK